MIATIVLEVIRSGVKRAGTSTQRAGNTVEKSLGSILGQIVRNTGKVMSWFGDHLMILVGLLVLLVVGMKKK